MRFTSSIILAGAFASLAFAQQAPSPTTSPTPNDDDDDDSNTPNEVYIEGVCMPQNSTGDLDLSAPCNQIAALETECMYGPSVGLDLITVGSIYSDDDNYPEAQDNRTQQICACESDLFELIDACYTCQQAHGLGALVPFLNPTYITSLRSSYCAVTATPTLDLAHFLFFAAQPTAIPTSEQAAYSSALTASFSDPIGNKTAVSYYYTPSVTGSAAWVVAEATGASGTSYPGSFATVHSSGGQIVPTVTANVALASAGTTGTNGAKTGTTSPSKGLGGRPTAGVMGMVGLMGVVAML